ncbi:hypothetical protein D3C85_1848980 [compost metagenome]
MMDVGGEDGVLGAEEQNRPDANLGGHMEQLPFHAAAVEIGWEILPLDFVDLDVGVLGFLYLHHQASLSVQNNF